MNCSYVEPMLPVIYTMGYEGVTIEDFIATLKVSGIDTIVDVREFPISRKKGFSKTAFSKMLNEAGIQYVHLVDLGCPKPIRDRYRQDKDWIAYTAAFNDYLTTQTKYLDDLGSLSKQAALCLVCFERDQNFCHRSLITKVISKRHTVKIKHLGAKKGLAAVSAS